MNTRLISSLPRSGTRLLRSVSAAAPYLLRPRPGHWCNFHASAPTLAVKPFILADIGEGPSCGPSLSPFTASLPVVSSDTPLKGITEVQIVQWFVQEGAHVNQFDKLCEVIVVCCTLSAYLPDVARFNPTRRPSRCVILASSSVQMLSRTDNLSLRRCHQETAL